MKKIVLQKPKNDPYIDRKCPKWFNDAKLGIFIHWGPYSVPGWAPIKTALLEVLKDVVHDEEYDIDSINSYIEISQGLVGTLAKKFKFGTIFKALSATKYNAYSEWYWNSMISKKDTMKYHKKVWNNIPYTDFGPMFDKESKKWKPQEWSSLFKEIGAKYVLITAKHHDGYCLYPTKFKNPKVENWHSTRDILGELNEKLIEEDIRLSLYYSAGYDWSLKHASKSLQDPMHLSFVHDSEGLEYFDNQMREIIDRYKPGMFWHDLGYSKDGDYSVMLDHYYKVVPDGVVNDRAQEDNKSIATRHFDYTTTEYFVPETPREVPWEICRGITQSFGYNRDDDENSTLTVMELVESFADILSKNGNLMLGLGPKADGTIPECQVKVVKEFGRWVDVNKDAIYETRPFEKMFKDYTLSGNDVRFTKKGNKVYAIVLGDSISKVNFKNLKLKKGCKLTLLGYGELETSSDSSVKIPRGSYNNAIVLEIKSSDIL